MNYSNIGKSIDSGKEKVKNPCPMCLKVEMEKNAKTGMCGTCARSYNSVVESGRKRKSKKSRISSKNSKVEAVTRCHFATMKVLNMDIQAEEKVEILKLIYGMPE